MAVTRHRRWSWHAAGRREGQIILPAGSSVGRVRPAAPSCPPSLTMTPMTAATPANPRILVTGASGFIGSHLVRALRRRGAEVFCLVCDHDPASPLWRAGDASRVGIIDGRLERFEHIETAITQRRIDIVFHLGAQAIVGAARRDPLATFQANIQGTWNVLESCRTARHSPRCIIIASSDKAYGACPHLPAGEDAPLAGRYPYDASKACADLLAQSYATTYGLPIAIARCGNVFGPGDLNFSRIVPSAIRSLLAGRRPVIRSDGSPVRDYVYVDDVVEAFLALAAWRAEAGDVEADRCAFNFSTGRPMTVLEIVHRIRAATGREDLEPMIENTAIGEIPAQHLDSTRAREVLGWRAAWELEAALARTVRWYRHYFRRISATGAEPALARQLSALEHGGEA
jgi:CDP-glucose 4,6-dehydratase